MFRNIIEEAAAFVEEIAALLALSAFFATIFVWALWATGA